MRAVRPGQRRKSGTGAIHERYTSEGQRYYSVQAPRKGDEPKEILANFQFRHVAESYLDARREGRDLSVFEVRMLARRRRDGTSALR
jgi:hypothetical protein